MKEPDLNKTFWDTWRGLLQHIPFRYKNSRSDIVFKLKETDFETSKGTIRVMKQTPNGLSQISTILERNLLRLTWDFMDGKFEFTNC